MANWNERDQDWRGARGWREKSGARGSFGESRYEGGQQAGYNPAGPAQTYQQGDYGGGGYGEDRSWNAGSQRGEHGRDYGDGGPTRHGRGDHGGDQRRYGQGGGDYDRGRYGEERYGNQGYGGQSYGQGDRQSYGSQWDDRQAYGGYGGAWGGDYRGEYGGQRYGQETYRGDYRRDTGFGDPNPYVQAATDGETQGAHRGRGPKDYRRSDDRIREDVNDRLTDDAHIDASNIQVAVKEGEVTLSGSVDSRFAKRHAEDLAERISGVRHVQNNLRVQEQGGRRDQGQAEAGQTTTGSAARGSSSLS
ncbi:MAG TPA: BON domain-containing protein [Caulobacter sp.]|nr:BON domain-containing protein [Caulobacter sp.]